MYIYKLTMTYDDELTNSAKWETQYLTHEINYHEEIFKMICNNIKKIIIEKNGIVDLKHLKKVLIKDYGFSELSICNSYEFEGE